MYSFTMVKAFAWADEKRLFKDASLFESGNPIMSPGLLQYFKSHIPRLSAPGSPKDLYEQLGVKNFQSNADLTKVNRKFDIVVASSSFDDKLDLWKHLNELWDKVRTGGVLILDLPASASVGALSVSPNFITYIRRYNDVDVSYLRLTDKTAQYEVAPDSVEMYSTRKMNDELFYKFKETQQLRLTAVIKKKVDGGLLDASR